MIHLSLQCIEARSYLRISLITIILFCGMNFSVLAQVSAPNFNFIRNMSNSLYVGWSSPSNNVAADQFEVRLTTNSCSLELEFVNETGVLIDTNTCPVNSCKVEVRAHFLDGTFTPFSTCISIIPLQYDQNRITAIYSDVCLPVAFICSRMGPGSITSLLLNGELLSWPFASNDTFNITFDFVLLKHEFCFVNISKSYLLLEFCHSRSDCHHCFNGEIFFISRTEVFVDYESSEGSNPVPTVLTNTQKSTANAPGKTMESEFSTSDTKSIESGNNKFIYLVILGPGCCILVLLCGTCLFTTYMFKRNYGDDKEIAGTEPTYEEVNDVLPPTHTNITLEDNTAYSRYLHKFEMTNCSAYELTKKI